LEEKPVEECKIMDAESLRWNVNRFPLPAPAPIAETYLEKNRLIEDTFCHEKLEVYQKSVEFLKEVISVIRLLFIKYCRMRRQNRRCRQKALLKLLRVF